MRLAGRSAIITGASRGLGLALARGLAQRAVQLTLTARGGEALQQAAAELARFTEVLALPGDVADTRHVRTLVDGALDRFGRIDILINNASTLGPSPMPPLEYYPLEALNYVFRVNALAPLHFVQQVLPVMRRQGEGIIVNVTSDAAVEAYPRWGGYGASKAALELQSRVLAAELVGSNIRVYLVDPGEMNTQMHQEAEPGVDLSHLPSPETVAPGIIHMLEAQPQEMRIHAQQLLVNR